MKTYYFYICPNCGNEFKSTYKPQSSKAPKYCSTKCYHEHSRVSEVKQFICEYCGKPFERTVYPSSYKDGLTFQFCSPTCRNKARTKPKIPCPQCGTLFFPSSRGRGKPKQKYCSQECAWLAQIGSKSPNRTPKDVRRIVREIYPQHGPEPIMKRLGLTKTAVQTIAYSEGVKLTPEALNERVYEPTREYMKNHNPMKRPEVRAKVSAWQKAHPEFRAKRDARLLKAQSKYQKENPTGLERRLWKILSNLDVEFEASAAIKPKFVVDIRIGNLIIQADGDYWHGHPRFEPLTKRQKAQQRRDKAQDAYLKKCGYTVVRIWESDMSPRLIKSILKEQGVI